MSGKSSACGAAALFFLVFTTVLHAQEKKPEAVRVSAYEGGSVNFDSLVSKTHDFLERLEREPRTTTGFVVFYNRLTFKTNCFKRDYEPDLFAENLVKRVIAEYEMPQERIRFLSGGLSLRDQVYYWLVPEKAEPPNAQEADINPPCCCPHLIVVGRAHANRRTRLLRFFVELRGEGPDSPQPRWRVSAGRITTGQGTPEIQVSLDNPGIREVTATVEFDLENSCDCPTTGSFTTKILSD